MFYMPKIADKQQRRGEIVDAAIRVILRDGLAGASMRVVAREAGCTIGMINHWFSSRDDLVEATFDRAMQVEMSRAMSIVSTPESYIEAAGEFLPLDERRRDEVRIWIAFYAMVLCGRDDERRRTERCAAVRKAAVEGLSSFYEPAVCHDIVDRALVLIDGIAINALLDPKRWTRTRQLTVLQEGLENVLERFGQDVAAVPERLDEARNSR